MSQKDYDNVARWYVVHTYSGYENKVKADLEKTIKNRELEDFFFDIIVPMEEQIEIKDGQKKTNLKKITFSSTESMPAFILKNAPMLFAIKMTLSYSVLSFFTAACISFPVSHGEKVL